jgi:hypothetical protein
VHAVCERAEIGLSMNCMFHELYVPWNFSGAIVCTPWNESETKNRHLFMFMKEDSLVL